MNSYLVLVYGICFSLIAGGAFALVFYNMRDIYWGKSSYQEASSRST
jgi:hypothetical protein